MVSVRRGLLHLHTLMTAWRCVRCLHDKNVVKYCAVAFLPLTLFLVIVITFHISATSPSMNAFVLVCQVLTSPMQVRIVSNAVDDRTWSVILAVYESLHGFWNLDFFRTVYPRFCLHPNMSTLQVLALDYIIAAYPLLLIIITYSLVKLHNHNCKLVVWLWKPFRVCFTRFQRQWDIQTSLIEAFASFLLLSYMSSFSVYHLIFLFQFIFIMSMGSRWNHTYTLMGQLNTLANSTCPMLFWQL